MISGSLKGRTFTPTYSRSRKCCHEMGTEEFWRLRLGGPGAFGGFGTFGGSPKHETKNECEIKLSPRPGYVSVAQICRGI